MKPRMLEYEDLISIPVRDNGDPLVNLVAEPLILRPADDMRQYIGETILVRGEVARRLLAASEEVSRNLAGARLVVVYGYRHPEIQQRYFDDISTRLSRSNPGLDPRAVRREAHRFAASPDVAGHPTGGAVDITISQSGTDLDMGSAISYLADPEVIPFFSSRLNAGQRRNRTLLRSAMMSAGFAPFDGEWWHFSHGDREWAAYYEEEAAKYSPILSVT